MNTNSKRNKKDKAEARKLRRKRRGFSTPTTGLSKSEKKADSPAPQPATTNQPNEQNLERVHFYIRHHNRVEMDILVSNMRFKWDMTEEQTWAAVQQLEAKRAVKVLYPNIDRSNATVSALWLE